MNKRLLLPLAASALAFAAPAQAALPGVSSQDENYLRTGAAGDSFEIHGGKIALQHSHNPAVRHLAHVLITDHTKSLHEAKRIARALHIPKVQNKATPSQNWELRQLEVMTGPNFDKQYSDLEVNDHHQDIEEAKFEAKHGLARAVVASAKKELPTLAKHLKLSRIALKAAGGPK